jgi:N-methylhydantoinase B
MEAGSVVHMETGGGGGFGNARERDPERVRTDVLDGFVTVEAARRDYGVLIDPGTLEVTGLER